ncbi:MAG: tetratricopeptide repeat protein [Hymenobacteraceae bacterium]|nr:tetratricopeptide repeat protein [Hymenobacteraceae bacterium]
MAKNITKKESEYELIENPDAIADRLSQSEEFVRKNRGILIGVFAAIAILIVGGFLYYNWRTSQNQEAQVAMFPAVAYFEADSLNKALNGDGQNEGLIAIADDYSGTKAGNLANFYAGVAYLKQGQFQKAIEYLDEFESDDLVLQSRAYSLIGDANMELGNKEQAADMYLKAANHKANAFFSPQYLMKAGIAYESMNKYSEAAEAYDKIITNYAASSEITDAKKYKARAEMLAK